MNYFAQTWPGPPTSAEVARALPRGRAEPGAATCRRSTARRGSARARLRSATWSSNIAFDGRLPVPVLTMHTTGDGLVVPENEQAYRERRRPGR